MNGAESAGRVAWVSYIDTLTWAQGAFDLSGWFALLRAASCGLPQGEAFEAVTARIRAAGGVAPRRRLESQCRRAYDHVRANPGSGASWRPRAEYARPKPKPVFDDTKLKAFAADWAPTFSEAAKAARWLGDRSSVDPASVTAAAFLEALYAPGENVLLFSNFQSQGQLYWHGEKHSWRVTRLNEPFAHGVRYEFWEQLSGPEGVWFLANPVDGMEHPNPRADLNEDGTMKRSRRSMEAVTSWRYLVLESDQALASDWLGALVQLPLRIVAIYTSGGRSVHALVRVDAASKAHWDAVRDALREALVILGADPAALTAVRLTRLPGCRRGGALQRLLYLNPAASGRLPICALPTKRDVVADWTRWAQSCPGDDDELSTREWEETLARAREHYGINQNK